MHITETLNEKLKRNIKVTIPLQTLSLEFSKRLEELQIKANVKGFRPGKVPISYLKKMYGPSLMSEIIEKTVGESIQSILDNRKERVAFQPQVKIEEKACKLDKVLALQSDLVFSFTYEILPEIDLSSVTEIEVTRKVVDVSDADIEKHLNQTLESVRTYTDKNTAAVTGDRVTIDYIGKVNGVPFEGGADQSAHLILGSGNFIPGFEEQLIGVLPEEVRDITVTFPKDYAAVTLAGQEANFTVTVHKIGSPDELVLNDETAKKFGLDTAEKLKEAVQRQVENHYGYMTRQNVKKEILDKLDANLKFDIPPTLMEEEFKTIWDRNLSEMKRENQTFESQGTTEEEQKSDFEKLAERRVRLGLILAEYGRRLNIEVTDKELQAAFYEQLRQSPGREQELYDLYQKNPEMQNALRAPLLEEKVIDDILSKIKVIDKKTTPENLTASEKETCCSETHKCDNHK